MIVDVDFTSENMTTKFASHKGYSGGSVALENPDNPDQPVVIGYVIGGYKDKTLSRARFFLSGFKKHVV
ncbi:hypothetical protein TWF281_002129 [Arthrobotrys megalospora]